MNIQEALLQSKIGQMNFIVAGTGRGKTYTVCHFEDWADKRVLFLVSRKAIKDQMVEKYSVNSSDKFSGSHITVSTYHAKEFYQHIAQKWDVIVCDEIHCLPMDSIYSKNFSFISEWIANEVKGGESLVVALSATPESALYVFRDYRKVPVQVFDLGGTANIPNNITIAFGSEATIETIIESSLSKDGKTLVFGKKNSDNFKRSERFPNSLAICSDTATPIQIDGRTVSVQKITGEKKNEIIKNEMFPDGVSTLFTTSTLREGMNIHAEENLRMIITEFDDLDSIIQAIGRYRSKIDNVYIILPSVEKMVRDIRSSLTEFDEQKLYLDKYLELRENGDIDRMASMVREIGVKSWIDTRSSVITNMLGDIDPEEFRAVMKYEHRIHLHRMLTVYSKGVEEIKKYLYSYLGCIPVQKDLREVKAELALYQLIGVADGLVDQVIPSTELRAALGEPKMSNGKKQLSFKARCDLLSEKGYVVEDLGRVSISGKQIRCSKITKK